MQQVLLRNHSVSRLCIGGNPFSGFSHQSRERDREMLDYYTPDRIKAALRAAEAAGITAFFGRTDDHILALLKSSWQEGGRLQWFAQISPTPNQPDTWRDWLAAAAGAGAVAAYIHGGIVDSWHAQGRYELFREALKRMRGAGLVAGFAGHRPAAHEWIRDHLDPDFQMCSHYNPTDRSNHPEHIAEGEKWNDADRDQMMKVVATIPRPVVHYKVFAGGNRPVVPAFQFLGRVMRPGDIVCIGMFLKDDPDMISKNAALFAEHVASPAPAP